MAKVEKRPTNKAKVVHMRDPVSQKMLVPIGGGKDSATTLEILQRAGADIIGFSVGSFEPIERCAKVAGIPMIHAIRRIDPSLLEMNASGAPNGHVPVTAINSMIAVIAAVASGQEAVVMSNEASADEPTRVVDSMEINHQWSKSSNAEKLLRDSLSSVSCTVDYFSLLRYLS